MEIPDELLVCGFCHGRLESPKLLPCLHTICGNCVTEKKDSLEQCPTCHQAIEGLDKVGSLPDDNFSKSMIEFSKTKDDTTGVETESLPELLNGLETQQNEVKINLKKIKLRSEEASYHAYKNERDFSKIKRKAETDIREKITSLKNRFEKYLQEKEATMMHELDQALDEEEFELSQSVIWNQSVMRSIENKEEILEKCNLQSIKSQPKALAYKNILEEMNNHLTKIGGSISLKTPPKLEVTFRYNQEIEEAFTKPLGVVEVNKSGRIKAEDEVDLRVDLPSPSPFANYPYKNAVYKRTFPTLLPEDNKGYVVGITWIPPDRLVLVDKWNSKLKLYHESGELYTVMVFSGGEPTDIVYTKGTSARHLFIVTIPSGRLFLQVAVEDKIMRISSRIMTLTGYTSISYDKRCSRLIGGVCQPYGTPRIDIINCNGAVEFTMASDIQRRPYFICPRSIDIFQCGIIAGCDWQKNRVLFISRDGTIQGSFHGTPYSPLINPVGTTLDGRDHLLVADCKRNKIHILSFDGTHLGSYDTTVNVEGPREINVISDGNSSKLAVSHGAGFISIYHLTD